MAPLRIEVTGESTIFRPAERAVVFISVESEGSSQDEVSAEVTSVSSQVRDLLNSLSGKDDKGQALPHAAITHWSNSSLSTGSYFRYGEGSIKKKPTRIYSANTSFEAKFQNFAKLGSVATTLSTMKHVSVKRVEWRLTDKTKAATATQCRYQAVHDAIAKAKDYAAALDRPAPPVVEIQDTGYGGTVNQSPGVARYAAAYTSQGHSQEELDFSPEDVSLQSSVTVIFDDNPRK